MSKIGLFYSYKSQKTRKIARSIAEILGEDKVEHIDAETVTPEDFVRFDRMILGVPTWFDGELPIYWDEFVPALKELDLTGKQFAIFGLGDQKAYPENFGDAVGIMADILEGRNGVVVGETSPGGYSFESSKALKNGKFIGLILDQENQPRLTESRISTWVAGLAKDFK